MKRVGNLYNKIISIENLRKADTNARRKKKNTYGVQVFDRNPEGNLLLLNESLLNKTFKTSEYKIFPVYEPKERMVYKLPYFPDRILHHAIMIHCEPLFNSWFTADTFSSIKKRGIMGAFNALKKALENKPETQYCLKIDIKKFYPNVDHDILKSLLIKKFKDNDLLWLFDEIIDSADGLPIGNYVSQFFANFYLTPFDHWIKEDKRIKYYFRYADDIVILAPNKPELHQILSDIREYFQTKLKLEVKHNYQIFPVEKRGIDFVGYVFFHTHILLRKSIKKRFARAIAKNKPKATIDAYKGWTSHSNTKNLLKKLLPNDPV